MAEEQIKYLQQAFEANNQMIELVNELLKVSRLESGKIKVDVEKMSLTPIIESMIKVHEASASSHNAELSYKVSKKSLPSVLGDPSLTESVLDNLVSNAIEYSDPGRKNNVVISTEIVEDNLRVKVSDKGIGIKDSDKSRVFTSFFRSEGAEKTRSEGTGLGLFIARMIIRNSGGNISFTSEYGKGTTFYFDLPIYKKNKEDRKKDEQP